MKKIFSLMAAAMLTTAATAQETYDKTPALARQRP